MCLFFYIFNDLILCEQTLQMINQQKLVETVLLYSEKFDSSNIERVKEYIKNRENEETDAPEFDFNIMTIVDGAVVLLVYEFFKKYIKESYDYFFPSLAEILHYFRRRRLKTNLIQFLKNHINEDEAVEVTNRVLAILKKGSSSSNEETINAIGLPLNYIPLLYSLLKIIFLYFFVMAFTTMHVVSIVYQLERADEYGENITIEEALLGGSDEFFYGFMETLTNEGSLAAVTFVTEGYSFEFFISLIITIVIIFFIKKFFYFFKKARIKNITSYIDDYTNYELRKSIFFDSGISIDASFRNSRTKNPFASKLQGGNIIGIPKKILEKIPSKLTNFLMLHEYYHVISKDASLTKYLKIIFLVGIIYVGISSLWLSVMISVRDVNWGMIGFIGLLFFAFAVMVRQNELRADFFAYSLTKDDNYEDYFSKGITKFNLFYPSYSQRISYIENPLKSETSLYYSFAICILGSGLMLALPYSSVRTANFLICGLLVAHILELETLLKKRVLPILKLIISVFLVFCLWIISLFIIRRFMGNNPVTLDTMQQELLVSSFFYTSILIPIIVSRFIKIKYKTFLPVYWFIALAYLLSTEDILENITFLGVIRVAFNATLLVLVFSVIGKIIKRAIVFLRIKINTSF